MATTARANPRRALRVFLLVVAVAAAIFVVGNVLAGVLVAVLVIAGIPVLANPSLQLALSAVVLQGISFGGGSLLYVWYRDLGGLLKARLPTLRDLGWIVGGFVLLIGLLQVISVLFSTLGIQPAENTVVEIAGNNPQIFLLMIPVSFVLIGPGEELLFRGVVQGSLARVFTPTRAIVLASAVFAVVHITSLVGSGSGRLAYILVVFALALVLGASYERTDNLLVPALIHGAYNAAQFAVQYLIATGAVSG